MNENKIKTYCFGSLFAFVLAFVILYCLPLSAKASSVSSLPMPYGFGSDYGYREWEGSNPIPYLLEYCEDNNITCYGMLMYEQASDNSYVIVTVLKEDFYFIVRNNNGAIPTYPPIYINDINGSDQIDAIRLKITQDGIITVANSNFVFRSGTLYLNGVNYVSSGVAYLNYPLYYLNYSDISCFSDNGLGWFTGFEFLGEIPPAEDFDGFGFGEMTGTITPASGVDSPGFDIDFDFFIDMNPLKILGEEIRDGIGSLLDKVEDGFSTVIGSIGDTFTMLQNNTQTLISKVGEIVDDLKKPTSQQLQDTLDNSTVVGGVVDIAQEGKTFLDSLTASGIQVPTSQDMDFDYPFTWKEYVPALHAFHTHTTNVHITFSWYESIRDKVLLVLGVFMTIGFTVYLIKQIPNLIAGVSGGASAGQSIADHVTNNKGGKK